MNEDLSDSIQLIAQRRKRSLSGPPLDVINKLDNCNLDDDSNQQLNTIQIKSKLDNHQDSHQDSHSINNSHSSSNSNHSNQLNLSNESNESSDSLKPNQFINYLLNQQSNNHKLSPDELDNRKTIAKQRDYQADNRISIRFASGDANQNIYRYFISILYD